MLDSASAGDTVNFLGHLYENLQLTINKKLNIIASTGTKLTGSALFLINGSQASGTQIIGFNITGSGILVNNTSNVTISDDQVSSTCGSAITVNRSSNTTIRSSSIHDSSTGVNVSGSTGTQINNNNIYNNKNGINIENSRNTTINQDQITNSTERGIGIYNSNDTIINNSIIKGNGNNSSAGTSSDEGAVYVKGSNGAKISNNQIKENSQGITAADSSNVTINNNTINDNYGEGILLNGNLKDITIKSNDIERNGNGIALNYNNGQNITIRGNLITGSVKRTANEDSGNGISFGSGYVSNSGTNVIEHNVILNNVMDLRATYAQVCPQVSSNWYGYNSTTCPGVNYAPAIEMMITRTGTNSYTVQFYDGVTERIITDLPSIPVTFTAGSLSQTVMTQNGCAIFQNYNLSEGTVIANIYGAGISTNWDIPVEGGSGSGSGSDTAVNITVTATPAGGIYNTSKKVTLTANENAAIYYTLNGSTPTTASPEYTGPIKITSTKTLKYIAVDEAGNKSQVYTAKYTIDRTAPKISSTTPKNGDTYVTRTGTIPIKFSERIKSGINWSKVYVKNLKTGQKIKISKLIKGSMLYIKTSKRSAYTWFQVYIPASAVKNSAGNRLAKGYTWKFKTGRK